MNLCLLGLSKFKLISVVSFYQIFVSHSFSPAPLTSTKLCADGFLFVRESAPEQTLHFFTVICDSKRKRRCGATLYNINVSSVIYH